MWVTRRETCKINISTKVTFIDPAIGHFLNVYYVLFIPSNLVCRKEHETFLLHLPNPFVFVK